VAIHREVGYMSGEGGLYPKMTATQLLQYMAELRPLKRRKTLAELIKRFDVSMNIRIRNLSRGNRQKVAILQAFMHEPKVLILDEPTSGLDPLMQEQFYQLVKERKEQGAAVFFSSHNLAEVQKVCDRIGFIREGRLISQQTISEVAATAANTFDITFVAKAPIGELKRIRHAKVTAHTQSHVTVYLRGDLSPLFRILAHHQVASINQREINLEDEFLRFYKKGRA
jgi:ABC-2 type transport system ATP-binding protein